MDGKLVDGGVMDGRVMDGGVFEGCSNASGEVLVSHSRSKAPFSQGTHSYYLQWYKDFMRIMIPLEINSIGMYMLCIDSIDVYTSCVNSVD